VCLQQTTPTTLDVATWCIILQIWEVLPSKVLLLEGWDGQNEMITCIIVHHIIFCIMTPNLTCFWWLFLLNYIVCYVGSLWMLPLC
jgi:membrane protease YdiL (CAAX protease family)